MIDVARTAFPAGDNGNANALLGLGTAGLVGQRTVGAVVVAGQSVTDAYASALANIGVRVQSAKLAADQSASIAADAKTAEASTSGVNLDEEAARLIQYQQSYQAAAKILQVAQTRVRHAAAGRPLRRRLATIRDPTCASPPPTPSTSASTTCSGARPS